MDGMEDLQLLKGSFLMLEHALAAIWTIKCPKELGTPLRLIILREICILPDLIKPMGKLALSTVWASPIDEPVLAKLCLELAFVNFGLLRHFSHPFTCSPFVQRVVRNEFQVILCKR